MHLVSKKAHQSKTEGAKKNSDLGRYLLGGGLMEVVSFLQNLTRKGAEKHRSRQANCPPKSYCLRNTPRQSRLK
jgi:hypothetical protein